MSDFANRSALEQKIADILRKLLMIEDDIVLDVKADLVGQIGLDSIEAFDAVATLHEILGESIPITFNPKASNSIDLLGSYIHEQFGETGVNKILAVDIDSLNMAEEDDSL
jgi:acyl carrier protein